MRQPIPIGITDFNELRTDGYYYVDKSMLIADIVRSGAKVILLPRPRRFGKTMNLSMLYYFFNDAGENSASLFEDLAVNGQADAMEHCAAYPTVFLTLKDLKSTGFPDFEIAVADLLSDLFIAHEKTILQANPRGLEKQKVRQIMDGAAPTASLESSLKLLMKLLHRATGKQVMVLIDEYDTPIHAGYKYGWYREIIGFMRNFLSGALKDNTDLKKGVLTGILRVAKESIFSGLNNLRVRTILDHEFSNHFGFTDTEVQRLLSDYQLEDRLAEVRCWYNGYRFGPHTVYNPWSIMQYTTDARFPGTTAEPYWVNTSDNQMIHDLIVDKRSIKREELEALLRGDPIRKELETNIIMDRMFGTTVWSLLTLSGYLKPENLKMDTGRFYGDLVIPNLEVRTFFDKTVQDWLREQTDGDGLKPLFDALIAEDMDRLSVYFAELVKGVLSYHDTAGEEPERVYHAFMLGLLVDLRGAYRVLSNREAGYGRYDVIMIPTDKTATGFVFEFKKIGEGDPAQTAADALQQIIDRDYATALRQEGVTKIRAIGVAVEGKRTHIASGLLT
ncbi:MAG: AAA family ATPase [Acidobacteriota bacterium]|nr:AAA family ATPase [Acidobacteriota bacterium]